MSLKSEVERLREIGEEAKTLYEALRDLANQGKDATAAQRDKLIELAERLDTTSREAARQRRRAEIDRLAKDINAHEASLSLPGLPAATRQALKADLVRKRTRRARLLSQEATDFGGLLRAVEVGQIVELVKRAKQEVRQKKLAALFLDSVFRIADLSLTLAGRFAL